MTKIRHIMDDQFMAIERHNQTRKILFVPYPDSEDEFVEYLWQNDVDGLLRFIKWKYKLRFKDLGTNDEVNKRVQ